MTQDFRSARLEEILRGELPLAAFMDVRVERVDENGLVLSSPEAPNANLHGSMFGGSIGALALLAGWGWVHLGLQDDRQDGDVVIQRASTEYLRPLNGPAVARALPPDPKGWERFLRTFRRRGRARIRMEIQVGPQAGGPSSAVMEAAFVALSPDSP